MTRKLRNHRNGLWSYFSFCIPALLFYLLFYIYPTVSGFYYSLTDWSSLKRSINFVGLQNFYNAFHDLNLGNALKVTVNYTVVLALLQNALGLLLAIAVDRRLKLKNWYRAVIFLPFILPTVVSSNIWVYIYNPLNGLLSASSQLLGLGAVDILGNPRAALWGVIATNLWQLTGFSMIIFYAGLQSIPAEIFDSGAVDGVNAWQRFWYIKLPLIVPSLTINILFSVINGLKVFDYIYLMTNGGPGNVTQSISAKIYFTAFNEGLMGYASALGVLLFAMILCISLLLLNFLRKKEIEA